MADEITVSTGLKINNGNLSFQPANRTTKFDQTTGRGGGPGTVNIGTTEETVSFGDITPGFVQLVNLDATNFVEIGFSTGVYGIKLQANGGTALIELIDTTPTVYAKADTGACDVLITAANK